MQLSEKKIGFTGAGNMASAMIKGMLKTGEISAKNIYVSDIDNSKLEEFKKTGINTTINNKEVVESCDIIILAVKPNIYPLVLNEISEVSDMTKKTIISIAAGISIKYVKSFFHDDVKVIRVMPNTPALIGEGMTVISYHDPVRIEDFKLASRIFSSVGKVECIDEEHMDAVVAVNGSSPAYVYMMIEAMADAAVMRGISRELAYKLASQSVAGAAKMVLETKTHPGQLKDIVCSPGGTTIKAVYELEKRGYRSALMAAMEKCTKKAIELGNKYR